MWTKITPENVSLIQEGTTIYKGDPNTDAMPTPFIVKEVRPWTTEKSDYTVEVYGDTIELKFDLKDTVTKTATDAGVVYEGGLIS